jgi:hypothetical protein
MDPAEASQKRNSQLKVIYAGLIIVVLMGLFPPWNYTFISPRGGYGQSERSAGYHPIFYPPPPEVENWPVYGVRIDFVRLLIQWIIVGLLTGGLVLFLRERKSPLGLISAGQSESLPQEKSQQNNPLAPKKPTPFVMTDHAESGASVFASRAKKYASSGITISHHSNILVESNGETGRLMVVHGVVLNESKETVRLVVIGGEVYNQNGQAIRSAMCYAGNTLESGEASKLTIREIQEVLTNKKGQNNKSKYLLPKSKLPFTLVFHNLPLFRELSEYRVAVMGFKSAGTFRIF